MKNEIAKLIFIFLTRCVNWHNIDKQSQLANPQYSQNIIVYWDDIFEEVL